MGVQYTQGFKEDAVSYYNGHRELGMNGCSKNLGISKAALSNWVNSAKEHKGEIPTRGSGNYSSDEAKEIARLKKELRDAQDALDVLKKANNILGR